MDIIDVTMIALGASTLAPWLAYIAAADFFIAAYPEAHLMCVRSNPPRILQSIICLPY